MNGLDAESRVETPMRCMVGRLLARACVAELAGVSLNCLVEVGKTFDWALLGYHQDNVVMTISACRQVRLTAGQKGQTVQQILVRIDLS